MEITRVIDISEMVTDMFYMRYGPRNVPIEEIELAISGQGLHFGTFSVIRVDYDSNETRFYFDYPTDMSEIEATEFIAKFITKVFGS